MATPAPSDVLANERTYLAYVRTALALMVAGTAIIHVGDVLGGETRNIIVGGVVLAEGIGLSVLGYLRWRDNDRQISAGQELHATSIPLVTALGVVLVGTAVLVLSLR